MKRICFIIIIMVSFLFSFTVFASETEDGETPSISGNIVISYSPSTGSLSARYSGPSDLRGGTTYTWYKGGSSVSTSERYKPTSTGAYYCVLTNDNYTGELTSGEITLYKASGKSGDITFNNESGLYQKGASVTAWVKLKENESVTGWKTNVKGVVVPGGGNPMTFSMPSQDITISPTISKSHLIEITGGTADKYFACEGDVVTIKASKSSKKFSKWKSSGASIDDPASKTTYFTMKSSDVKIEALYEEEEKTSSSSSTTSSSSSKQSASPTPAADANNAVFEVLSDGGFEVNVRHAAQGPLCDRAFRAAQGRDWLVTDYMNITINNDYNVYELPSPIRLKLSIPRDLQKAGRYWRMLCISRGGVAYTFYDEDSDDSTITFSPDRFYAYAMVFNDEGFSNVEGPALESVEVVEQPSEEASEAPSVEEKPVETSSSHNVDESQTLTSKTHSVTESKTAKDAGGEDEGSGPGTGSLSLDSDKSSAVRMAHGTSIPTFQI